MADGSAGMNGKTRFLALVAAGDLQHDVMTTEDLVVRMYGDTAVATGWGKSGGTWQGQRFLLTERSSNVFVRRDGRWMCVLTHLSALPDAQP